MMPAVYPVPPRRPCPNRRLGPVSLAERHAAEYAAELDMIRHLNEDPNAWVRELMPELADRSDFEEGTP